MANNSMNFNVNFNSQFDSSQILKGLEEIRKKMGAISADEQIFKGVDKEFVKLKSLLSTLDAQSKNVGNAAGLNAYQRTLERVRESANRISQEMGSIAKNETQAFNFKDVADAQKKIQQLNSQLETANKDLTTTSNKVKESFKGMGITPDDATMSSYVNQLAQGKSLMNIITQDMIRQTAEVEKIRQKYEELNKASKNVKISANDEIANKGQYKTKTQAEAATTQTIKNTIGMDFARGIKDADSVLIHIQSLLDAQGIKLNENSKVWDNIRNTYTQLVSKQETLNSQFEPMKTNMNQITSTMANLASKGVGGTAEGFKQLQNQLIQDSNAVNNLNNKLNTANSEINNMNSQDELDKLGNETAAAAVKTEALVDAQEDSVAAQRESNQQQQTLNQAFDRMGNAVKNVLSIGNAYRQLNRYIRQTFQDVQRLDQAFTSIAMVTNYQVGDLWEQYDKYSELANKLGQTTEGAIKSSALFYQQGLDTAEALSLTEDTLKMATLAGEDYTTATTQMTAALRGFHMEMEEGSRVTDVYSELAANAAASVQGIAYAMSKTASIANNAGMSFETTAAFITNMIETTQEAPENIGTAMKTIIARFTELKENVDDSGEDLESMDFNKVDKALKSVGVQLKDTTGSFRNLDDVFLELSSKWDTLTRNQQRYIATIAAGSRQQSRFIAMMEDYERTLELVETAQNSTGRSDEQFAKYADAITFKLNQLKNSWEELRVSFLGADDYKKGLDFANSFLNSIKNIDPKKLIADLAVFSIIGTNIINQIIQAFKTDTSKVQNAYNNMMKRVSSKGFINEKIFLPQFQRLGEEARIRLQSELSDIGINIDASKITNEFTEATLKANQLEGEIQRIWLDLEKGNPLMKEQIADLQKEKDLASVIGKDEQQIINHLREKTNLTEQQVQKEAKALSLIVNKKAEQQQNLNYLREQGLTEEQVNGIIQTRIQLLAEENVARKQQLSSIQRAVSGELANSISSGVSNAVVIGLMTAFSTGDWKMAGQAALSTFFFSLTPIIIKGLTTLITTALGAISAPVLIAVGVIAAGAVAAIAIATANSVDGQIKKIEKEKKKLQEEQSKLQEEYSESRADEERYKDEQKDLEKILDLTEKYNASNLHTQEESEAYQNELADYAEDYSDVLKLQNDAYEVQVDLLKEKLKLNEENLKVSAKKTAEGKINLLTNEIKQLEKDYDEAQLELEKVAGVDSQHLASTANEFIAAANGLDETSTAEEIAELDSVSRQKMEEAIQELAKVNDATNGDFFKELGITTEQISNIDDNFAEILKIMQDLYNGKTIKLESAESKKTRAQIDEKQKEYEVIIRDTARKSGADDRATDYLLRQHGEVNANNANLILDGVLEQIDELQSGVDYLDKLEKEGYTFTQESVEQLLTEGFDGMPENVQAFLKDYFENLADELEPDEELKNVFGEVFSFENLDKEGVENFKKNISNFSDDEETQKLFEQTTNAIYKNLMDKYGTDTTQNREIAQMLDVSSVTLDNYNQKLQEFVEKIGEINSELSPEQAENMFNDIINGYTREGLITVQYITDDEEFEKNLTAEMEGFQKLLDSQPLNVNVKTNIEDLDTDDVEKLLKALETSGKNFSDFLAEDGAFNLEGFVDSYNEALDESFNNIIKKPEQIANQFINSNLDLVKAYEDTTKKEIESSNELFLYYKQLVKRKNSLVDEERDFYNKYSSVFEDVLPKWDQVQSEAAKAAVQRYISEKEKLSDELDQAKDDYEKYKDLLDLFNDKREAEDNYTKERYEAQKKIDDQIKKNAEDEKKALDEINSALEDVAKQEEEILEKEQNIVEKTQELNEALYGTENYLSKRDSLQNYTDRLDQLSAAAERAKKSLDNPETGDNIAELVKNYGEAIHQEMIYQQALNSRKKDQKDQILGYLNDFGSEYFSMVDGYLQANYSAIDNARINDQLKDQIYQYLDDYNKIQKEIIEGEEKYNSLLKDMKERRKSALSDMVKLQKDTAEILKNSYEKEIEDVREKYDAIKEADDEYLEALQDSIDKQRKLRDEENQWNDLATKEKKLSLISRDTSGSQQKETLKLQDEIEKDRQSLLDSSVDNILNTLKETYEEQQKEREEELAYQEKMIEDMDFMKQAMEIISSMNGDSESFLNWRMENDPEYLEGSPIEQELYIEEHANDLAPFQEYLAITNSNFQEYLEITTQEVDEAVSGISDNVAEYLERSHQNTLDKIQEEQDSAQEALNQAYADLDEAKTKLAELDEKVNESYENYDEVIREGSEALNDAYANQKEVIRKTENDIREATDKLNDSLLKVYGTTATTEEAVTKDAEQALAHYNSVQMNYHKQNEGIKNNLLNWMEQVAVAAMDESALQAVQNARNIAANNVNNAAENGDIPAFESAIKSFEDVVAKTSGLENYIAQHKADIGAGLYNNNNIDKDAINSEIDAYNAALQDYSKIDDSTPHPFQTSKAYSDLDSRLDSIKSKIGDDINFKKSDFKIGDIFGKRIYHQIEQYKTGGLVDYTGPAWVDGSPTSPEAFLSAEDTARIGAAAQLLSNLPFLNTSSITDNSYSSNVGDTTIEVHINIENVSSEQDIDDMINRVRDDIVSMSNQIGNPVLLNK